MSPGLSPWEVTPHQRATLSRHPLPRAGVKVIYMIVQIAQGGRVMDLFVAAYQEAFGDDRPNTGTLPLSSSIAIGARSKNAYLLFYERASVARAEDALMVFLWMLLCNFDPGLFNLELWEHSNQERGNLSLNLPPPLLSIVVCEVQKELVRS